MTTAQDPVDQPAPEPEAEPAAGATISPEALAEMILAASKLPESGPLAALPSGEMEITLGGSRVVHLPRPLFGQMKVLIRAEGRLDATLKGIRQRNSAFRNKLLFTDLVEFEGDAGKGNIELSVDNLEGLAAIRDESLRVAEEGEDAIDAALTEFWQLVFATLVGLAGTEYEPDDWPADLLDASIPKRAIAHWRYAQPGPG